MAYLLYTSIPKPGYGITTMCKWIRLRHELRVISGWAVLTICVRVSTKCAAPNSLRAAPNQTGQGVGG